MWVTLLLKNILTVTEFTPWQDLCPYPDFYVTYTCRMQAGTAVEIIKYTHNHELNTDYIEPFYRSITQCDTSILPCRVSIQYRIRRLTRRSRKVSKTRDWVLNCSYCLEIWQTLQQKWFRGTCPFSEPLELFNHQSHTFKTSRAPWWRHQMRTFSSWLAPLVRNSPVTGEFPAQRPVPWSFDVFLYPPWIYDWVKIARLVIWGDLRLSLAD